MSLAHRDILTAKDIERRSLDRLFQETDSLREKIREKRMLDDCRGSILATVFMEPSTRTRLSFQSAMTKVGGSVVDFGIVEVSSIMKGETFEDTMRMVDGYEPDVIAVRSKEQGSAKVAADVCDSPVINAGDGSNEHPTQAMLDLYTIRRVIGRIDGVRIGLMGDLAHSRTTNSLSYALDKYDGVQIFYIAPKQLRVKEETTASLSHIEFKTTSNFEDVIEELDFLYVTRVQKERFESPDEYEKLKSTYQLSKAALQRHKKLPYILHPLPRVDELATDVDRMSIAKYFEQAKNGMYVRAALLKEVVGK
jgi:aspartate carbamoyltransferase catalytic subunit